MKKFIVFSAAVFALLSCAANRTPGKTGPYTAFEIIRLTGPSDTDTGFHHELRFYRIQSAHDAMILMYQNYGRWDASTEGNYQSNIDRLTWRNLPLLEDERTFTVIADGAETGDVYNACMQVIDENNRDCFDRSHPLSEELANLFVSKMSGLDNRKSFYKLFKM